MCLVCVCEQVEQLTKRAENETNWQRLKATGNSDGTFSSLKSRGYILSSQSPKYRHFVILICIYMKRKTAFQHTAQYSYMPCSPFFFVLILGGISIVGSECVCVLVCALLL